MKNFAIITIIQVLILTSYSCSRPNKAINPSGENSLTYILINNLIESELQNFRNEHLNCKYLVDKFPFTMLTEEDSIKLIQLDTLFNNNDLDTIFKQNLLVKNFSINPDFLNVKTTIISSDTLLRYSKKNDSYNFWKWYHNKYGHYGVVIISPPLFSTDHQTAILKYSCAYHRLNGESYTLIYKKIKNKWKTIYILDHEIS